MIETRVLCHRTLTRTQTHSHLERHRLLNNIGLVSRGRLTVSPTHVKSFIPSFIYYMAFTDVVWTVINVINDSPRRPCLGNWWSRLTGHHSERKMTPRGSQMRGILGFGISGSLRLEVRGKQKPDDRSLTISTHSRRGYSWGKVLEAAEPFRKVWSISAVSSRS